MCLFQLDLHKEAMRHGDALKKLAMPAFSHCFNCIFTDFLQRTKQASMSNSKAVGVNECVVRLLQSAD